jgi:hypothetical protein
MFMLSLHLATDSRVLVADLSHPVVVRIQEEIHLRVVEVLKVLVALRVLAVLKVQVVDKALAVQVVELNPQA